MESENVIAQILQICGESHRDRHVGHRVFQNQIPADNPRENFAQNRVGVGVGAARDRNHRGQFGETQAREQASDQHDQNDTMIAGPGPGRPSADAAARPMRSGYRARSPAAALDLSTFPTRPCPVTVKIPDPMTIPTPRNASAHGPSVFFNRCLRSPRKTRISSSMLTWCGSEPT